jgi:Dolichyl-phosphate-mannose-protein mannosyltransferase
MRLPITSGRRHPQLNVLLPFILLLGGFAARLAPAASNFLNPDEALHYLLSQAPSLGLVYRASLTTAHPPLLIIFLHYWSFLGKSELILRLPSVIAGTAFCWLIYLWLQRVANHTAALAALALLLFSPPLIEISAEVRQYALLLFFVAGCLYCFDRSLQENSTLAMALAFVSLDLAILTHYSSFIFALVFGIYSVLRLRDLKARVGVRSAWMIGQLSALLLAVVLLRTHVSRITSSGFVQSVANTYFRSELFHPGSNRLLPFLVKNTGRLFRYLAGSKSVGALEFLVFAAAIVLLFKGVTPPGARRPAPRQLGLLLILPFIVTCGLGLAGGYPYGGSRHDVLLAPFLLSGVAITISLWKTSYAWLRPAALGIGLVACNLFPSHVGPFISRENQKTELMARAMAFLEQSAPSGSTIITDKQGGLLLDYYLCRAPVVTLAEHSQLWMEMRCGGHPVIAPGSEPFAFGDDTLLPTIRSMGQAFPLGQAAQLWLFRAGWLDAHQTQLQKQLESIGCGKPITFGRNISICRLS